MTTEGFERLGQGPRTRRLRRLILAIAAAVLLSGFLVPEGLRMPVAGATASDWNHETFWYEPWGPSGVHKGIDIFGSLRTPVTSATLGLVVYAGDLGRGGRVVMVLGPKWRLHYYAHLDQIDARPGQILTAGAGIGKLGDSGNAAGKPPHLHYSILTAIPYPWRYSSGTQGWLRMFFLNPHEKLISS